jgi:hypothetical protein
MGLRKLDLFMSSITDSTQRSYKGGWSHFVSFFIEENDPFPNWKDEDKCIIVFGDFITLATDNIKLSEINIMLCNFKNVSMFTTNSRNSKNTTNNRIKRRCAYIKPQTSKIFENKES